MRYISCLVRDVSTTDAVNSKEKVIKFSTMKHWNIEKCKLVGTTGRKMERMNECEDEKKESLDGRIILGIKCK